MANVELASNHKELLFSIFLYGDFENIALFYEVLWLMQNIFHKCRVSIARQERMRRNGVRNEKNSIALNGFHLELFRTFGEIVFFWRKKVTMEKSVVIHVVITWCSLRHHSVPIHKNVRWFGDAFLFVNERAHLHPSLLSQCALLYVRTSACIFPLSLDIHINLTSDESFPYIWAFLHEMILWNVGAHYVHILRAI